MEQQPFLFYNPGPQHGPHGHFTSHPHQQPYHPPVHFHPEMMKQMHVPMHYHQHMPMPHPMGPPAYLYAYPPPPPRHMLTPVASPQPIYPRPSVVIESQSPRLYATDPASSPSTPPLSSSNSSMGSPSPSCTMLPTPANEPVTYGFPDTLIGVKMGCEKEVMSFLGGIDDLQSPQMRPGTSAVWKMRPLCGAGPCSAASQY